MSEEKVSREQKLVVKLNGIGWALFLIWIGIALLFKLRTGIGVFGIGIIALGMQAARKYFKLTVEKIWLFIGLLFLAIGIFELLKMKFPFVPLLIISAGVALLVSAVRSKEGKKE